MDFFYFAFKLTFHPGLTLKNEFVNIPVHSLEVAFPPKSKVGGKERAPTLRLQNAHAQNRPPVLQQFLLSTPYMDGLHGSQVALRIPTVHQRQVIDGHLPVLLVVGLRAVLVAVLLVSPGIGFVPVVGKDRRDQKHEREQAHGQADRRYKSPFLHVSNIRATHSVISHMKRTFLALFRDNAPL